MKYITVIKLIDFLHLHKFDDVVATEFLAQQIENGQKNKVSKKN
jgi:hypothetical protein